MWSVWTVSVSGNQDKFCIPGVPGGTKPGAGRIGRMIAEEMSDSQRYEQLEVWV